MRIIRLMRWSVKNALRKYGGERGIRTLDGAFDPILPKQGSAFDQLGHLSNVTRHCPPAARPAKPAKPLFITPLFKRLNTMNWDLLSDGLREQRPLNRQVLARQKDT